MTVPPDWLPPAKIRRVIVHWTGGTHKASGLDRTHYHVLIEGDGTLVRGLRSIAANGDPASAPGPRASHTLNCNTGSIGVSLCAMGGGDVTERPFNAGRWPLTRTQWDALTPVLAAMVRRYGLAVTEKTILTHAEVQANLGIPQRQKWDISRLPFDLSVVGAKACGDLMRDRLRRALL